MIGPAIGRVALRSALLATMGFAATANAAAVFTVTDLGAQFHLNTVGGGGTIDNVSTDAGNAYVFRKQPVWGGYLPLYGEKVDTPTETTMPVALIYNNTTAIYGVLHESSLQDYANNTVFEQYTTYTSKNGLISWSLSYGSPANDFNLQGEVVGANNANVAMSSVHGDLNNAIASSLGIRLTSAISIDDVGDIVAQGVQGGKAQYYLLTPDGEPTPTPEPTTLAIWVVGVISMGVRASRRRR